MIVSNAKVRANVYATTFVRTLYVFKSKDIYRLLLQLTVTAHEAVYATCCIDKFALTCIEWVRGT